MKELPVLLVLMLAAVSTGLKFNKPRILLPVFDDVRVNYTLEVLEKGCFNFRVSSGTDLITLQPIYDDNNDCTHKVLIIAISREKTKKTAIVLAESVDTGEVLRCDVIVDLIHSLAVHTTTRELYLEEAPETFALKAQDAQGNDFTTLEGVEFTWLLGVQSTNTKQQDANRQQVLRFLSFSESKYHQVPREIEAFETMGKKGHMILLDGINSGSAKVIVKLPHKEYKIIPEVQVDITVLANLIIHPMDVHILVGDSALFQVFQLKQGKLHEITIGGQYFLEIGNSKFASMSDGIATGLSLGSTEVTLKDRNVIDSSAKSSMPKARITVSEAEKIVLNLLPHYNWITVENEQHEIAIDLYTKSDKRITLGSKFRIESTFDAKFFKEATRSANGSRVGGETIRSGTNPVTGRFLDLIANAEMLIYGKLQLKPRLVILPYDPNKPVKQQVQFTATGGDGVFTFSTANPSLLSITQAGLSECHLDRAKDLHLEASRSGSITTSVKVAMSRNQKIFKTAEVLFLPPVKLQIVGYHLETSVNDFIDVHVGLFGLQRGEFVPFTACDNLQFDIEFSSQIFTIVSSEGEKVDKACRLVRLKGVHVGSSSLTVSFRHGDEVLKDEVQLLVYEKLRVVNPESNVVVLPIGSSRNVIYQYGPRKTFNVGCELQKDLKFVEKSIDVKEIHSDFQDQRFAYNILCREVSETKVHLEVYNLLNQNNFMKKATIFETVVHCVKPRFINLLSLDKLKTSCPLDSKSSLLHVRSTLDALEIEIEVLDQQKRKLQNITSLFIDVSSSQPNGAINHNIVYERISENDDIDGVLLPKRDFLRTPVTEANIDHKITAIVKSYDAAVLKVNAITPESPIFGIQKSAGMVTPLIENELDLLSFDSALLPVTSVSVFLAPELSHRIRLGQGSGYYDIKVKHPSMLEVRHDQSSSELVLVAKQIGETVVEISDRCLKTEPSRLYVSIVAVGRVELRSPDRVERTKTIEAFVRLFDSNNELVTIDSEHLEVYQMTEKTLNERVLTIHRGHQENLQRGEIRYIVTGKELGESKIVVTSGTISSTPASIQVFPPLQLIPRNVTILVGSTFEISSRGGPTVNANVVYTVANGDILSIEGSLVEGLKVGKTKVFGRSVGRADDGSLMTFTEDFIYITVVPLSKVKIRMPLQRLKSGNTMPATLWAEPDISPIVLGTLKNLRLHWRTDAADVVELKDVFEDIGVVYGEADAIAMRVRGLKQGKGKIIATVHHGGAKFHATAEVTIFKNLELESPKRVTYDPITIPPRTTLQLKVNLEDTIFEVNEQADSNIINVSKDGIVKSFDTFGTSLVVATSNDQKLDIPIDVKVINYVMVTIVPSAQMKGLGSYLPGNLNFHMKVSLHDNLGNDFSHSFEDNVKWTLSNQNYVEVRAGSNLTVAVRILQQSSSVLAVSLKDATGLKYPEDFVKLSVQTPPGVFSRSLLVTTGDLICFESPLMDGFAWHSFNSDALLLHGSVGRVLATTGNQKVAVHYGQETGIYVGYELDIRQPDSVKFHKSLEVFNGETYHGFFTISNHQQADKSNNLIANNKTACEDLQENFPIDFVACKLTTTGEASILKKFEASPMFDKAAGSYACEIRALASLEEITSIARSKTINFQLEARLPSGIHDKIGLRLTPAVQIYPKSISIEKLHQQEVTITGMENILQKVEISSSHPDHLILIPLPKVTGKLQFKPKLIRAEALDSELQIIVKSPLTHQTVYIPIMPAGQEEKFDATSSWVVDFMSNIGKVIAISVLVLTSIAMFLMCQKNRELDTSGVFQNKQNLQHPNQTYITNNNNSNPNIFTASPLQSQRPQTSPIKLSPTNHQLDNPITYGDPTFPSPYRRYHKRTL